MTAKEHNKIFSILMFVQGGLQLFGGIFVGLIYGGIGTAMLANARRDDEQMVGGVFIGLALIVGFIVLAFAAVSLLAAWKMLKEKSNGRIWGIVASIVALFSFPLGTALGIYGLWFLFGDLGKRFYSDGIAANSYAPPPPPNSWQ